jgi:hypothetical protein
MYKLNLTLALTGEELAEALVTAYRGRYGFNRAEPKLVQIIIDDLAQAIDMVLDTGHDFTREMIRNAVTDEEEED